ATSRHSPRCLPNRGRKLPARKGKSKLLQTLPWHPPIAATTTNYREIHLNEVEALQSIYGDDFENIETAPSAWHQSSDVAFKLAIRAPSNPNIFLVLRVELPATYPKTIPNLSLENLVDFREGAQSQLQEIVRKKPSTLLGSEMIYELALAIQDVLEDVAQAREHNKDLPSLEDERKEQEETAILKAELKEQEELRKQQAANEAEERALQDLLQEKARQRSKAARLLRRKSRNNGVELGMDNPEETTPGAISFDPPLGATDSEGQLLIFRAVHGKTLLKSHHSKKTFTVRPVVPEGRCHVPLFVLKEIFLDEKGLEPFAFREKMRAIEDRLENLKKLRHPNLVEFVGFKILRPVIDFNTPDQTWVVFSVFEFANKGSLSELLDMVGTVAVDTLRGWMIQLLEALEFYHRNGFVHGNIHCGQIMLYRNPSGNTIVKLQSSVEEALPDSPGSKRSLTTSQSPLWLPPELTQGTPSTTMKTDVWDLGIVLLQMGFGKDILLRYTSANQLMVSLGVSPPLQDLLKEFFRPDPKKRPTAFQLQPSEFFRVDAPLVTRDRSSNSVSLQRRPRLDSFGAASALSRYHQDFDEAGHLGRGGFGQVVKARNKLDGRFYAVKKISQSSAAALKDTLSEIMLLSRLNHPYVVRYYTAWLEEDLTHIEEDAISSTEGDPFASRDAREFSTGGLDFISSSGYPKIEFAGSDSDDDQEGTISDKGKTNSPDGWEDGESEPAEEISQSRTGSYGRPLLTTLYIQMEYCEKHTLRDLIKNGLYDDTDRSWRLFRQILDGLSHIHSHGIIHRDLKPDNIFIDVANNPRIGDFGLATSGQFTTAVRSSAAADFEGNFTRSLGTTYYVAPEMKSGFLGHYNEKVDMYSLGVIFFEMNHPLPTNMERDHTLRSIREESHLLPEAFSQFDKVVQGQIIESLLNHKPAERPTAAELLSSGKIPLQVEEETFRRAIVHLLSDPNSPDYKKILSAIFSQSPKKVEDMAWDMESHGTPAANELLVQGLVREKLSVIFRRHGSVEAARQMLFPRSHHYGNNATRYLLEKTFAFGTVYRESTHGSEPRSHREVDFDIMSYNTLDLALKEAEVIKVLDEIIEEFPPLRNGSMCFLVNHSDLLQLIMEFCRISSAQIPMVKDALSKLHVGNQTMQKTRSELRSPAIGVASTSLDDLAQFDFRGSLVETQRKIQTIMEGTEFVDRIPPIFARLNILMNYLQSFGVKRKVYINPLSSVHDKFYRGSILFQCIFDRKRRDVFAAGGRYDRLIQEFSPKVLSSRPQAHAVGFNLSWDRLSSAMSEYLQSKCRQRTQRHALRFIGQHAGFDATVLRTLGIKIIEDLWANGISAELAVDTDSMEELLVRYREHNHRWIVIVKQDSKERGFKVRNLIRREDYDIRSSELVTWLRAEVLARQQREGTVEIRQSRQPSQQDILQSNEKANDVRILIPQHRSKKTNRRNIVESALMRSRETIDSARSGPIAAIDTRDEVLESIRDTRLSDPESWRYAIQNAPLNERKYLGQVYELLRDLASESRDGGEKYTNAFIYNYRTGSCVYYDLGRTTR
ncbi:hypothetical protein N7470_006178, partial [Penicillium chermesinum]